MKTKDIFSTMKPQPNTKLRLTDFFWSDYHFASGLFCHVCNPNIGNKHSLIPEWIKLAEPLYQPPSNSPIRITALAKTPSHSCLWWHPWQPSQVNKGLFYAIEKTSEISCYLLFQQSQPYQLIAPFRLIVFPITDNFPKSKLFWGLAEMVLMQLPTLMV